MDLQKQLEWKVAAREFLILAKRLNEIGTVREANVLYNYQQALEWIAKVFLLSKGATCTGHELETIAKAVKIFNVDLSMDLASLKSLSKFAGGYRYPDQKDKNKEKVDFTQEHLKKIETLFWRFWAELPGENIRTELDSFIPTGPEIKYEFDYPHYYLHRGKHIQLDGFFPNRFKIDGGSCHFVFDHITLRGNNPTYSHNDILKSLFRGIRTPPDFGLRGFIECRQTSMSKSYIIQLKNNRFLLNSEQVDELCELVDRFSEVYLNCLQQIENSLKMKNFSFAKTFHKGIALISVRRGLWDTLIDFARDHDYLKGQSEDAIYYETTTSIAVYPFPEVNHPAHLTCAFSLSIEKIDSLYASSDEVDIIWEPNYFLRDHSISHTFISKNHANYFWDCERVHEWLVSELIPNAL